MSSKAIVARYAAVSAGIAVSAGLLAMHNAHAQLAGGVGGDPIAMGTSIVTYMVRLAQIVAAGVAIHYGWEHWRGHQFMRVAGDFVGGAVFSLAIPHLLGF